MFGRDSYESDALVLELAKIQLQRAECEVAEWTPSSAVEGDKD